MFKPLALYIGLRYTRAKRRNHFISFISLTSMLGIALGVTALITVLSVMNGFEKELRERMLGMAAHVVINPMQGSLANWKPLLDELKPLPRVTGVAPYVQGQAMVTYDKAVRGAMLQGVDPVLEPQVSKVQDKMLVGNLSDLKAGEFGIVIGEELARALGVNLGDKVTIVVPQASVTPVGVLPRMKRMDVKGIFRIGMHEFDSAFILMNIEDAAKLLRIPEGQVDGLNMKLDDMFYAQDFVAQIKKVATARNDSDLPKNYTPEVANKLKQALPPEGFFAYDWSYRHANFFKAIKMEKAVMFIILALIVAVAAFNIVSTLVMVVTDKQADIAILRTLGATPLTVMTIFMVQGTIIGVLGTIIGDIGGISLALNVQNIVPAIESFFHVKFLSAEVYYISELPSDLQWMDVYKITGMSLLISLFATIYPALQAARTQPAEALRYE